MALLAALLAGVMAASVPAKGDDIAASRLQGRIILDGKLDEAAWAAAPALTRAWEIFPGDLTAPRERTEARFLYDDTFLYIGIRASLRSPETLRAPYVRRDRVNASQDYVQVYLDPLGAGRGSYLFRVNARGSKADAVQDEDKQTETTDPDFAWDVATQIDAEGWSAELRIPLSSLRISRDGPQAWKVVVYRGVPRDDNVQSASAPVPRVANCFLCYAGELTFADLHPVPDNLLVTPSETLGGQQDRDRNGVRARGLFKPSLDAEWLPYPGAAVDLTIKPDFVQVAADQPQLTSNARFAINLPEKRPFFREGSDLIQTTIPVLDTRTVLAPAYGLRFTTRSPTFNATAFAAKDEGEGGIVEPGLLSSSIGYPDVDATVAYARARWIAGAVDPGGVVAIKLNDDGSYNLVGGPDVSYGVGPDRVSAQLAYAATHNPDRPDLLPTWRGQDLGGFGGVAEWDHTGQSMIWTARYSRFDDGFRTWLGYVPRVGYQDVFGKLKYSNTFSGVVNELSPYMGYEWLEGLGHAGDERDITAGLTAGAAHNTNLDLSVHPDAVVLNEQGLERTTRYVLLTASANPAPWLPLAALSLQAGRLADFTAGDVAPGLQLTSDVEVRPLDRLDLTAHVGWNHLSDNPAGGPRLNETVTEITATWFFSARLYVLADAQRYTAFRRFPATAPVRTYLLNAQMTYEVDRDLSLYAGVRAGTNPDDLADPGGRRTEVYFKVSRTFHLARKA